MFFLISKIGGTVLPNMTGPVPGCYFPRENSSYFLSSAEEQAITLNVKAL